jgi:hypothetical protein
MQPNSSDSPTQCQVNPRFIVESLPPDMPPVTQEHPATDMFSLMPSSVFDGLDFDFLAQDTCEMFDWAAMNQGGLNS